MTYNNENLSIDNMSIYIIISEINEHANDLTTLYLRRLEMKRCSTAYVLYL